MSKKHKATLPASSPSEFREAGWTALLTALYFLAVCLSSSATVKATAMQMILLAVACVLLFFGRLREQIKPPLCALALVVVLDGISCFYAVSGKFALYDFLKIIIAFCLILAVLSFAKGPGSAGRIAAMLSGTAALAGLVSIDHLSTRLISTPVLTFLSWFTPDYAGQCGVETGVRILGLFFEANVFAGCIGLGVLLSLGLAASAPEGWLRQVHIVCLFINSLAFVLAFSMGAVLAIALAFIAYLLLERKENRAALLILMIETLVVTLVSAAVISRTSLTPWTGFRPMPLLCVVVGAAMLCGLHRILGSRAAAWTNTHNRALLRLFAGLIAVLVVFAVAAYHLTGGITLQEGTTLRRSAYPAPGSYTLVSETETNDTFYVRIETQNLQDTMMHTSTVVYEGALSEAAFSVPEDSLVTYFYFQTEQTGQLESVKYIGETDSGSVPLGYKLLPSFIANRLQGLFANQNAIQRLVFAWDGLKMVPRSPLIGLGLGAYENALAGVQSFRYATMYPHNHYVQALVETGSIGLLLFVGLFVVSGICVWRGRRGPEAHPLIPALGAALVFMAGHGAVEVVFSACSYLPLAYGVFALINLCCGDALPTLRLRKKVQVGTLVGLTVLLVTFGVLLGCNIMARNLAFRTDADLSDLTRAASLDRFERADYMLNYIVQTMGGDIDEETRRQAGKYAEQLAKLDSNSIPIYLAEYYLNMGQTERGLEMAEKYVRYVASDPHAWEQTFQLLEEYAQDTEDYRAAVLHLAELLEAWNRENMGEIVLDEDCAAFIARMDS